MTNMPEFGININVSERDWIRMILDGIKTVETRNSRFYKTWKRLEGKRIGLVMTNSTRGRETGILMGVATISSVFMYNDNDFESDNRHCLSSESRFYSNRCGILLEDVVSTDNPIKLKPSGIAQVRRISI